MSDTPSNDVGLSVTRKELEWLKTTNNHTDKAQLMRALDRIRDEGKKMKSRNESQKRAIADQMNVALKDDSWFSTEAKEEINKLLEEFKIDFRKVETSTATATLAVTATTSRKTSELGQTFKWIKIETDTSKPEWKIHALANIHIDDVFSEENQGYYLTEVALANAIRNVAGTTDAWIKKVYKNITGKDFTNLNTTEIKDFQDHLTASLAYLQAIWVNAGLELLLAGKHKELTEILANLQKAWKLSSTALTTAYYDKISPTLVNVVSWVWTIVAWVATGGLVTALHEDMGHMSAEKALAGLKEKADRSFSGKLWDFLVDVFKWDALAIRFWEDDVGNYSRYYESILKFTESVTKITSTTESESITDPVLKALYPQMLAFHIRMGGSLDQPGSLKVFQRALIELYISQEWYKLKWSDLSARIGIWFIGGVRQWISQSSVQFPVSPELQSGLEKIWVRTELSADQISSLGIKVEKTNPKDKSSKYKYTYPSTLKQEANGSFTKWLDTTNEFDKHQNIKLEKQSNGSLKFIFSDSNRKDVKKDENVKLDVPASNENVAELRIDKMKRDVHNLMFYTVNRGGKPEVFREFLEGLGSGDDEKIQSGLSKIRDQKGGYVVIADQLGTFLKDPKIKWELVTYKFGSRLGNSVDVGVDGSIDEKKLARLWSERKTRRVLEAEWKVAGNKGLPALSSDTEFNSNSVSNLSGVFAWQSMSSLVISTPTGGPHMIDAIDGSFRILWTNIAIDGENKKWEILDAMEKQNTKWLHDRVKLLNDFLKKNNVKNGQTDATVDVTKYKEYIKTGDISKLGVWGLQVDTAAKFIEARACIQGNLCLNSMFSIGWPKFKLISSTHTVYEPAAVVVDVERWVPVTPLATPIVSSTDSRLGLNPVVGFIRNNDKSGKVTTEPGNPSVSTNTGNVTINPGNTSGVTVTPGSGFQPVVAPTGWLSGVTVTPGSGFNTSATVTRPIHESSSTVWNLAQVIVGTSVAIPDAQTKYPK